jgi:hypothetical protein
MPGRSNTYATAVPSEGYAEGVQATAASRTERLVRLDPTPHVHLRDPATEREAEAWIAFGLPCSDRERQGQVVVRALAPVELRLGGLGRSYPAKTPDSSSSEPFRIVTDDPTATL